MKNDIDFGCQVNPKILEDFLKTFNYASSKKGDTIKRFIEDSMKKRIEENNKKNDNFRR